MIDCQETDFSLPFFQFTLKDLIYLCSSDSEIHSNDVQSWPSLLPINRPIKSFTSFHVFLRNLKKICNYLNTREINDSEKCVALWDMLLGVLFIVLSESFEGKMKFMKFMKITSLLIPIRILEPPKRIDLFSKVLKMKRRIIYFIK